VTIGQLVEQIDTALRTREATSLATERMAGTLVP